MTYLATLILGYCKIAHHAMSPDDNPQTQMDLSGSTCVQNCLPQCPPKIIWLTKKSAAANMHGLNWIGHGSDQIHREVADGPLWTFTKEVRHGYCPLWNTYC